MAAFPGGGPNTFVPGLESSNALVAFARNPRNFPYNTYVRTMPVSKSKAHYARIDTENAARIIGDNAEEWAWAENDPAPALSKGTTNTHDHDFPSFQTKRYAPGFGLGGKSVEEADFDLIQTHSAMLQQQAATIRALKVSSVLSTAGNYGGTATATAAGGGKFDASSAANMYIKKAINHVVEQINLQTMGVVQRHHIHMVVSLKMAHAMAETGEIQGILQQSPFALGSLKGDVEVAVAGGLPPRLYGLGGVTVEDTVRVSTKKGAASTTRANTLGDTVACFIARFDEEAAEDSNLVPTLNAITLFEKEFGLQVEQDHPLSRRAVGQVVEDSACEMTAPAASYLLTAASDL